MNQNARGGISFSFFVWQNKSQKKKKNINKPPTAKRHLKFCFKILNKIFFGRRPKIKKHQKKGTFNKNIGTEINLVMNTFSFSLGFSV